MFILTRRDVEITSISHPSNKDKKISVLLYQNYKFRLVRVFENDREKALIFWRDLVDNKGMACIFLEESESNRFSVWGKFDFNENLVAPTTQQNLAVDPPAQISSTQTNSAPQNSDRANVRYIVKACLLILKTINLEIGDLFGARKASQFKLDVLKILLKGQFAEVEGLEKLELLLSTKDLASIPLPNWGDRQMQILLQELYVISQSYFGNTLFLNAARKAIEGLPPDELTKFQTWLSKTPHGNFWQ